MFTEEQIIELFFPAGSAPKDDCAFVQESGTIVTCDSMAEETHFRSEWHPPASLARKLFQSNLSDLAAGGADPSWCLLQLGIPSRLDESFLTEFAGAFRDECETEHCPLIGGDTYRSNTLTFSVTMAGRGPRPVGRHASPGDALYLTGEVGLSLAGLQYLQGLRPLDGVLREQALKKHLAPTARLAWARELRNRPDLHGMMDVSDGVAQDAERFAGAAGVSFIIFLERLPVFEGLEMSPEEAACSGEEYELLFSAPPGLAFSFPAREIGHTIAPADQPVRFLKNGQPVDLAIKGFRHFQ